VCLCVCVDSVVGIRARMDSPLKTSSLLGVREIMVTCVLHARWGASEVEVNERASAQASHPRGITKSTSSKQSFLPTQNLDTLMTRGCATVRPTRARHDIRHTPSVHARKSMFEGKVGGTSRGCASRHVRLHAVHMHALEKSKVDRQRRGITRRGERRMRRTWTNQVSGCVTTR
jgi:hypothetical protein